MGVIGSGVVIFMLTKILPTEDDIEETQ